MITPLPIDQGGTGADTAAGARDNLGLDDGATGARVTISFPTEAIDSVVRPLYARGYEVVNLLDQPGADNNSNGDMAPVLENAVAKARTRQNVCVLIPGGKWRFRRTTQIVGTAYSPGNPETALAIVQDPAALLVMDMSVGDWFQIGAPSGETRNFEWHNLRAENYGPKSGFGLSLTNTRRVRFLNAKLVGPRQGIRLGVFSPGRGKDDVVDTVFDGLYTSGGSEGLGWVKLESAGSTFFRSPRFNGGGVDYAPIFYNGDGRFDGLFVDQILAEAWSRLLDIRGRGGSNVTFNGGMKDRGHESEVYVNIPADGESVRLKFLNMNWEGRDEDDGVGACRVFDLGTSGNGVLHDVQVQGGSAFDYGGPVLFLRDGPSAVKIANMTIDHCAHDPGSAAVFRCGQAGAWLFNNTVSAGGGAGYAYGVDWEGPPYMAGGVIGRGEANNSFADCINTPPVIGAP